MEKQQVIRACNTLESLSEHRKLLVLEVKGPHTCDQDSRPVEGAPHRERGRGRQHGWLSRHCALWRVHLALDAQLQLVVLRCVAAIAV